MGEMFESATTWLRTLSQNAFKVPDSAKKVDAGWYAGMSIKPAEFSEQLGHLQLSLLRTSQHVNQKTQTF